MVKAISRFCVLIVNPTTVTATTLAATISSVRTVMAGFPMV